MPANYAETVDAMNKIIAAGMADADFQAVMKMQMLAGNRADMPSVAGQHHDREIRGQLVAAAFQHRMRRPSQGFSPPTDLYSIRNISFSFGNPLCTSAGAS